jgi:hypothetical protein
MLELYDAEYGFKVEVDKFRKEEKEIVNILPTFQVLSACYPHYALLVVDISTPPS